MMMMMMIIKELLNELPEYLFMSFLLPLFVLLIMYFVLLSPLQFCLPFFCCCNVLNLVLFRSQQVCVFPRQEDDDCSEDVKKHGQLVLPVLRLQQHRPDFQLRMSHRY
jgi:hypothetical protein